MKIIDSTIAEIKPRKQRVDKDPLSRRGTWLILEVDVDLVPCVYLSRMPRLSKIKSELTRQYKLGLTPHLHGVKADWVNNTELCKPQD